MKIDLDNSEIEYLKNLFDYTAKMGTNEPVKFEEMVIFDKIKNTEESQDMTVIQAIEKLQIIVKANCGVSETLADFLKALTCKHKLDISNFCELDSGNFKAVQILINAMKTEDRFVVWNTLEKGEK